MKQISIPFLSLFCLLVSSQSLAANFYPVQELISPALESIALTYEEMNASSSLTPTTNAIRIRSLKALELNAWEKVIQRTLKADTGLVYIDIAQSQLRAEQAIKDLVSSQRGECWELERGDEICRSLISTTIKAQSGAKLSVLRGKHIGLFHYSHFVALVDQAQNELVILNLAWLE